MKLLKLSVLLTLIFFISCNDQDKLKINRPDGAVRLSFADDIDSESAITFKKTQIPVVSIDNPERITLENFERYRISGTCSENGENIVIKLRKTIAVTSCNSGTWSTEINVSKLKDENFRTHITAIHTDKTGNKAIKISEVSNYLSNTGVGHSFMERYFKLSNLDDPVLPPDCNSFDTTLYVSTEGSNSNNGLTRETSLRTIQKAVDKNQADKCYLVRVAPGDYNETVNIKYNKSKKITIFGEDRYRTRIVANNINANKGNETDWEKLTPENCPFQRPCNIYKKTVNRSLAPHNEIFHYKDKIVPSILAPVEFSFQTKFNQDELNSNGASLDKPENELLFRGNKLNENGRRKFIRLALETFETNLEGILRQGNINLPNNDLSHDGLGSLHFINYNFDSENPVSEIYFKAFDDEPDPTRFITFNTFNTPYNFYIVGNKDEETSVDNLVIQNFTIKNSVTGINALGTVTKSKFIGNIIYSSFEAIKLAGSGGRGVASNVEIYGNMVSNGYDFNHSAQGKSVYRNFQMVKAGGIDPYGIYLKNIGDNINVHHNFIHDVANAIISTGAYETYPSKDLKVHHNFIANVFDDALEISGDCQKCQWYSNHIRNAGRSIRLKTHKETTRGPIFIYKNILYQQDKYDGYEITDQNPDPANTIAFNFMKPNENPIYVYNNLFIGYLCVQNPTDSSWDGVTLDESGNRIYMDLKHYMLNNIFSCKMPMTAKRVGSWPTFIYRPVSDNQFIVREKNKQSLYSHNWIGGIEAERLPPPPGEGDHKRAFENEYVYNFAKDEEGVELNYLFKRPKEQQQIHYYGQFGADSDNLLRRKNFCMNSEDYPMLVDGGVDVSNAMRWRYDISTPYQNNTYNHKIDREITEPLLGIEFTENNVFVGPFPANSTSCNNFQWLLED